MKAHLLRALVATVLVAGLFLPTITFAQDDGSIAIGDVVLIDTNGVNIRDEFGTDGDIITTLEVGTSLEILDGPETADDFTWWLAVILDEDSVDEGVSGWLVEDYLAVDDGDLPPPDDDDDDDPTETPEPTETAEPEPTSTPDDDDIVDFDDAAGIEVLDGPVNVRLGPGTNSDIIGTLDTGETAAIVSGSEVETSSNYHWVNIEFGDDEGWIATAFLRPLDDAPDDDDDDSGSDDPLLDADAVSIFDGPLNVRGSASTDGIVVDTLPTGTILNVWSPASIESGDDYEWLNVDYLGDEVFVATDFVEKSDLSCDLSPCVAGDNGNTDDDNPFANADDVVVIDGPLNLRSDPGLDGDVLEVLDTGVTLPTVTGESVVDADGYTWVQVSRLSGTPREGWLATDFLAVGDGGGGSSDLDAFDGAIGGFVIDGPLNLRENPDTGADILLTLAIGDYVWIDALTDDGEVWEADGFTWIRVSVAGELGYLAIDFVSPD
jgi:uncharacterized protein YgiM (DUF1202 family)